MPPSTSPSTPPELPASGTSSPGPRAVPDWVPPPIRATDASRPGCRRPIGFLLLLVAGAMSLAFGAVLGVAVAKACPPSVRPVAFLLALVAPSALVTCWMARRRWRDPCALDPRPFAAGWVTPVVLVGGAWLAGSWWTDWRRRAAFTAAAWTAKAPSRVFLADDLVRRDLLVGLDAAGVEALVGPPDYFRNSTEIPKLLALSCGDRPGGRQDPSGRTVRAGIWILGSDRQFMADEELVVEFDESDRVVLVWIDIRSF